MAVCSWGSRTTFLISLFGEIFQPGCTRRGVGLVTTILVAVVAVLGTAIYFLTSGSSLLRDSTDNERVNNSDDNQPQVPAQQNPITQPTAKVPSQDAAQQFWTEAIKVTNSHIWVATNNTSTAAMVVQNAGSTVVSINSISIRGLSVPLSSVYYNTADATASNINSELIADYSETTVNVNRVAGEEAFTLAGAPITLAQGQAAILYIDDPANLDAIDAGLAMTISVSAGQASAVQSASVLSQN